MPTVHHDGAEIYYESHGDGEPVVWIMGLGLDSRMMLMFTHSFKQYRNILLDNRGAGRSSVPPGPYTTRQMAGDVLAVMDDCGVDQARVVGMSLGGAIAQEVSLQAPERVRSLTLCCTFAGPNEWHRRLDELGQLMAEKIGFEAVLKNTILLLFTPKFVIEQAATVGVFEDMGRQFTTPLEPFFHQAAASQTHDTRERLGSLKMPVLVMGAARDIFVPPELSQQIASLINGSRLEMFESGHAFMLEEPERFNAVLGEFLASH